MRAGSVLAVLLCSALAVPAHAQIDSREGIMLQNQIFELRHELQVLEQRGAPASDYIAPPVPYQGQSAGSGLDAQLLDRVQTLEDQVRQLRGQLDEQSNALRVAQEQLAKQIADLNFRLGNGVSPGAPPGAPPGGTLPASPPARTSGPQAEAPPAASPHRTPERALQQGNAALARRDYKEAEAAAREVLADGGKTPRGGDANFLLAQALMGQRDYKGAAVSYDDAYKHSRTGARAPDALLGLANALTGLDAHPAACATLDKLRREFPSARGNVRDTAAKLRARNGCG